jgi:hypothetical protein
MQRPAGRTILTGLAWSAGLVPWSMADGMIRLHPSASKYGGRCVSDHPGAGVPPKGAVLQTITAQVGSASLTCCDACGLDQRQRRIPRMSHTSKTGAQKS